MTPVSCRQPHPSRRGLSQATTARRRCTPCAITSTRCPPNHRRPRPSGCGNHPIPARIPVAASAHAVAGQPAAEAPQPGTSLPPCAPISTGTIRRVALSPPTPTITGPPLRPRDRRWKQASGGKPAPPADALRHRCPDRRRRRSHADHRLDGQQRRSGGQRTRSRGVPTRPPHHPAAASATAPPGLSAPDRPPPPPDDR